MNTKGRIIHVIDSLGVGGAEKLLKTSLSLLPDYSHIVCYLTKPDNLARSLNAERVIFLDFRTNKDLIKCALRLRKIIKKEKPLFIHAHLLKSTWISRLAAWRQVPVVFTIHNVLSEDAFKVNRLSLFAEKATYQKAQTLISVSDTALKDYRKWIGVKGKSFVLYNAIAGEFFEAGSKKGLPQEATRLIAVGNLRRQKNYVNLINAFQYLKEVNVSLDIYGTGDMYAELEELIKSHKLPVQLKGLVSNIPEVFKQYDAFIMSSTFEGYGIAPVEAMAAGLPVLLSDIEVFHEITDGNALFFNPLEPQHIARAIRTFIDLSPDERVALSNTFKRKAFEIASAESFTKKLTEIYNSVLNN